jgi:hypothetical protein
VLDHYTYENIAELVRQRADLENSTFVVDGAAASGELYNTIHLAAEQHYENLCSLREDMWIRDSTVVTVAGTAEYALQAVTKKVVSVRLLVGDYKYPLRPFNSARVTTTRAQSWGISSFPWYSLRLKLETASQAKKFHLLFDPPPNGVYTVHYSFIRDWGRPLANSELVQLPFPEWIVLDAAIRLAAKEERDASDLVRERELLSKRIETWFAPSDQNWPKPIHDHRANEDDEDLNGW